MPARLLMSHTCKTLVIHCMDFRFHSAIRDFLVSLGLKDQYDLVSIAGASKGIADGSSDGEVLLKQIKLSQKLHGISEVYLLHHMDCGAYGGSNVFPDAQSEKARHTQDLNAAKAKIQEQHPTLIVQTFIARLESHGVHIDFEKVV